MKSTLKPGLTHRFTYRVPDNKTVPHLYPEVADFQAMPRVFATADLGGDQRVGQRRRDVFGQGLEFFLHSGSANEVAGAPDLFLQQKDTVEQCLGSRWTAWNVNVHRHDPIAAAYHRIGIMIIAAAIGARAH